MTIDTTIVFLCLAGFTLVSVSLNIFFIWYMRGLLGTLNFFSENLEDLTDILSEFRSHLESVYGMETFYGDQTLNNLMLHCRQVTEQLEEFEEIINFSEESEPEEGELMDDQEQENESEPANSSEEKKIPSQIKVQF
tara:strand:+ start:1818 stop:2228 length:411 start_codon:yes stop_codon:yes gene_type:complete